MAWPGDRRPSDALDDEFVPQIWSARVLDHVRSNLVSQQVVNTSWKSELKLGDKLWIPVWAELTGGAVDVTSNTVISTNTNTSASTTDVYITIDVWWEVPATIDDSVKKQTQVGNMLSAIADNCAYALQKKIDTEVNTLFSGLGGYTLGSTVYGSDGQTFTDDLMIQLMETLDENNVPRTDRSLVVDPSTVADIYKIDKFVRMDYQKEPVSSTGKIGQMYGIPVYVSTNLVDAGTGSYGCLLHRDAIGLVIQDGPTVEKWRNNAAHCDVINVSAMWGSDELRDSFGVPFYTRLHV